MSVRVGIVGLGYWGSNLARNLNAIEACELAWCCDVSEQALFSLPGYPEAVATRDIEALLADPHLDAVALTTPVATHADLAERVLAAGKHCFVEKPMATDGDAAERLAAMATERGLVLMVGHLLSYHPCVRRLRDLIAGGELGPVHYMYSQRLNLGKLRADESALWSLGAHDVSVMIELADAQPAEVTARGGAYVRDGIEDVVFAHLHFASGLIAHMHLSCLDPHKTRKLTIVGADRMATFDDMAQEGKLAIWDKGFDAPPDGSGEYVLRSGASWRPYVPEREPLRLECEHFIDCVARGSRPRTDGEIGARVVRVLESLQESLDTGGSAVAVAQPAGFGG